MDTTEDNPLSRERFAEIVQEPPFLDGDVVPSKMFGMPCIKVNGKAFAGLYHSDMTFKLAGDSHAKALDLEGACLFDPSHMGRPMKEWVQVPFENAEMWREFAESALQYVGKK